MRNQASWFSPDLGDIYSRNTSAENGTLQTENTLGMDKLAIRKQRTEVFVGLFVFFGLAIMGTLILQFGRFSDRVRGSYAVHVDFADGASLRSLSPVKMGGQQVGFVKGSPELKADFSAVAVDLAIYEDRKIPIGSKFQIGTSGLMGDTFVEIVIAEDTTALKIGLPASGTNPKATIHASGSRWIVAETATRSISIDPARRKTESAVPV